MGRPLKKKFFGNLNSPYNRVPQNDTGTGGQSVNSVVIDTPGSYNGNMPFPLVSIDLPELNVESNTTATAHVVTMKALSAAINAKGSGYQIGDLITVNDGGTGSHATFRVTKLRVLSASLNTSGSSTTWDGTEWIVWDAGVNSHWTSPTILKGVTADGGHRLTGYNSGASIYGVWNGTDNTPAPTTALTIVGGPTAGRTSPPPNYNTRASGDTNGSGAGDNNGFGGSVTFTYGVEELALVTPGSYTATTSGIKTTTHSSGSGNDGLTVTVTYGVNTVAVDTAGSGYIAVPAVTFSGAATGHAVLTNRTKSSLNVTAWVPFTTNNTVNSGGSGLSGDIVKQEAARRYYVDTPQGHGQCKLVTTSTLAIGQMTLIATDVAGSTYFVEKLTAHKTYLVQKTLSGSSWLYANNAAARWTIYAASTGTVSLASD
jgi:hypothetical protein